MKAKEYRDLRDTFYEKKGQWAKLVHLHTLEKKRGKTLARKAKRLSHAITLVQKAAQLTQDQLRLHIAPLITRALQLILPDPLEFVIDFVPKRGRTEARMSVRRPGGKAVDPMDSMGGGVVDVVTFALRICLWCIQTPRPAPIMILDEPFRFLSPECRMKAGELMRGFSTELGIQFIIVTHDRELAEAADRTFSVSIRKGISHVETEA